MVEHARLAARYRRARPQHRGYGVTRQGPRRRIAASQQGGEIHRDRAAANGGRRLGVCCATLGEAEVMASGGLRNLLITTAVVTDTMIDRLIALDGETDGLMIVVDNPANVESLASAAQQAGRKLGVLVDFDVGQGRTGVTSVDAAVALARRAQASAHLAYRGRAGLLGHLQHIADYTERERAARAQTARVGELISRLEAEDLSPTIVTGGGTGTFDIDFAGRVYTEIQPGSYPFMDLEYLDIPLLGEEPAPFAPALIVQASVVSANLPGFAIVNGGYKSFATEGGPPRVASPQLAGAKYRFMGDEQAVSNTTHQAGL
jgi:3-hydroxy-D-aspartate aldolase